MAQQMEEAQVDGEKYDYEESHLQKALHQGVGPGSSPAYSGAWRPWATPSWCP